MLVADIMYENLFEEFVKVWYASKKTFCDEEAYEITENYYLVVVMKDSYNTEKEYRISEEQYNLLLKEMLSKGEKKNEGKI